MQLNICIPVTLRMHRSPAAALANGWQINPRWLLVRPRAHSRAHSGNSPVGAPPKP